MLGTLRSQSELASLFDNRRISSNRLEIRELENFNWIGIVSKTVGGIRLIYTSNRLAPDMQLVGNKPWPDWPVRCLITIVG